MIIEIGRIGRLPGFPGIGLGELLLVLIDDETVRHHRFVRSRAAVSGAEHERALEPAAVLVGGFEIEIGRDVELWVRFKHRDMRAAGIDPHIKRVAALLHARGQAKKRREFRIGFLEPDVGAFAVEEIRHLVGEFGGEDGLVVLIEENRQWHTPGALTRDAPIRPRLDSAVDAVAAPRGQPFDLVDFPQRFATQGFERDEELFDGAEDDGRFRAPAMWIRVLVNLAA